MEIDYDLKFEITFIIPIIKIVYPAILNPNFNFMNCPSSFSGSNKPSKSLDGSIPNMMIPIPNKTRNISTIHLYNFPGYFKSEINYLQINTAPEPNSEAVLR